MTKTIDTLVNDIYGLFGKDSIDLDKGLVDQFGANLVELMHNRFDRTERSPTLRMSNIGKPDRQLWYELNHRDVAEDMSAPNLIKFMYGDLIEQMILLLVKQAGHRVEYEQAKVSVEGITGHLDCVIDGIPIDVKSASSFSFQKFASGALLEDGNDPFGYVAQLAGYTEAVDPDSDAGFLAVDKTLGKICLLMVPNAKLKEFRVVDRIAHVKEMIQGDMPERCYADKEDGKSGNRTLAIGCSYCKFKNDCWSDANGGQGLRTFRYSTGPKFLTAVAKLPQVEEIGVF